MKLGATKRTGISRRLLAGEARRLKAGFRLMERFITDEKGSWCGFTVLERHLNLSHMRVLQVRAINNVGAATTTTDLLSSEQI